MLSLPSLPFLVVIRIAPLAAAEYQIIRRKYTIKEKILRIFKYSIYTINPQKRYN
jgi:hypothetical protein